MSRSTQPRPAAGTVLGVVLAAGAGTRYGMPKIAAAQGRWLEVAVRALADGGCDEVTVAMGARVVEPPAGTTATWVGRWADGLSETVRAAVLRAVADPGVAAVVLHVVDTPDVGPDVVRRVLARGGRRRDVLTRAVYGGRPGHPVLIGADHFDPLLAGLAGDTGAGRYLAAHRDRVQEVECGDLGSGRDHDVRE